MFAEQFAEMQRVVRKNGLTPFSTMQNHYNLLYREDERDLIPLCDEQHVSRIPYSPLAGGHLSHRGWESGTLRSNTDTTIQQKYDHARQNDLQIIERVSQLAERYGVSMAQIALAWHIHRGVAAPIVGATKTEHFDTAVQALSLNLTDDDIRFIEEPYEPHTTVGALTENIRLEDIK